MPVYLIADMDIHDPSTYDRYVVAARPIVKEHGGRYLAAGGTIEPLSGTWTPERIVMIEFPTREAMTQCFQSAAYTAIAHLREQSATSRSIVVEGV